MKLLIQSGSDINAKTTNNQTPLFCVLGLQGENENLIRGQEEIALFLLGQEGIDVSGTIESSSLLHLASSQGMDRASKALLDKKLNPNDPGPSGLFFRCGAHLEGLYPIHLATKADSAKTVEVLLLGGARAESLTPDMESPLMLAVYEESLDLVIRSKPFLTSGQTPSRTWSRH